MNANFPSNPGRNGLPTVQGVLILFDAACGRPLAIMDSAEVTRVRTASASALAARYLAPSDARTIAIIGCGVQGRAHVEAMRAVRPIGQVVAYDRDHGRADAFARDVRLGERLEVVVASTAAEAACAGEIVVTCTSATEPILFAEDLRPGTFVAAVGADAEQKQEIDPALMGRATVVCDVLEQCAAIGDLHHALSDGTMTLADVAADLTELVAAGGLARADGDAVRIFDSTGTALEDVAAAAIVYERASTAASTRFIDLAG